MILTREQLENRLASLHRASLELVKDISLESLLERIAALACQEVGARYAAVGVQAEDGSLQQFIPVGMTVREIAKLDHPPVGHGLIGALMHSSAPIRLPDLHADPRSVGFPPHHPQMTSFLGVPIQSGNTNLGQIYLTDKLDHTEFTEEDEKVIETLASYAAVAIANARLYQELHQRDEALTRRSEDLALLNELASTLATSIEVDQVLDIALTRVVEYLHVDAGEIYIKEEAGNSLSLVLHRGSFKPNIWLHDRYPVGEGLVGKIAESGKMRMSSLTGQARKHLSPEMLEAGFQQIACFPLTGYGGVLGVLCVAVCPPSLLGEREVRLLTTISSWSGTAIENTRLIYQGKRLAILEERERIGMDLHDGIIQSIYAVGLTLEHARLLLNEDDRAQATRRINQAVDDLNSTIRDIRAYILDLRPRQLHEENLAEGLQRLVNEFKANTFVETILQIPSSGIARLPQSRATALFHICQETLANVAKHAHARRVEIAVWNTPNRVLMEIRDDGRGMELDKVSTSLGHGLSNMHTRARNVDGDVEITSAPGEGTTVLAWVPLPTNGR